MKTPTYLSSKKLPLEKNIFPKRGKEKSWSSDMISFWQWREKTVT